MSNDINDELKRLEDALKESDPELAKELEAAAEETLTELEPESAQQPEESEEASAEEVDFEEEEADLEEEDAVAEETSKPVKTKKKKGLRGLLIYNAIVIAGILGVLIFWYVRYNALFL